MNKVKEFYKKHGSLIVIGVVTVILAVLICFMLLAPQKEHSYNLHTEIENSLTTFMKSYSVSNGFTAETVGNVNELYQVQVSTGEALISPDTVESVVKNTLQAYDTLTQKGIEGLTEKQVKVFEESVKGQVSTVAELDENGQANVSSGLIAIVEKYIVAALSKNDEAVALLQTELNLVKQKMALSTSDAWKDALDELEGDLDKIEAAITDLENNNGVDQTALQSYVREIRNSITTAQNTKSKAAKIVLDIKEAEQEVNSSTIQSITDRIAKLEKLVIEAQNQISTLSKDFADLQKKVNALESTLTAKDNELNNLINKYRTELLAMIQDNQKEIDALEAALDAYKNEVSNYMKRTDAAIKALQDKDSNLLTLIDSLNSSLSSMRAEYQAIINNITGSITELQNKLRQQMSQLEQLQKDMTSSSGKTDEEIAKIKELIAALNQEITINITRLEEQIEQNQVSYDSDIEALLKKIANLQEQVDQCFQSVSEGKKQVAAAITDKGVPTAATDTFGIMADHARQIGIEANVVPEVLVKGYRAYGPNGYVDGTMQNIGPIEKLLSCSEQVVIPAGYTSGGIVAARDLASQTVADAVAANLSEGKTAWINGVKVVGNGQDVKDAYKKGCVDGAADAMNGASVQYTYHKHTGSPVTGGGCYGKAASHKHSGSSVTGGGCYTTPVYHQHTNACYSAGMANVTIIRNDAGTYNDFEQDEWSYCQNCSHSIEEFFYTNASFSIHSEGNEFEDIPITGNYRYCNNCNMTYFHFSYAEQDYDFAAGCGSSGAATTGRTTVSGINRLSCGKTTSTVDHYDLGCGKSEGTTEGYVLTCDKTEQTIESATIIFN